MNQKQETKEDQVIAVADNVRPVWKDGGEIYLSDGKKKELFLRNRSYEYFLDLEERWDQVQADVAEQQAYMAEQQRKRES